MSKKIAQLTKVIYHLNTKNEDHAVEMEVLAANHQVEIQNILRDAANRIAKFKEMVETRQQALNQDVKVEKLVKKHDQEKQAAQSEVVALKTKLQEREQKLSQDFQSKYEALRREVEMMNKKFQEKIQQFESVNTDLRRAVEDAQQTGSLGLEDLRKRYEGELANAVREANEKFQSMLIEQLAIQEELKREAASRLQVETDRLRSEHERDLGQTRAKLSAEKQELQLALRHEAEQQRVEFTQRLDRITTELQSRSEALSALQQQSDCTIRDLRQEIQSLRQGQEMAQQEAGGELRVLRASLLQREEERDALQALLSDKSAALAKLETDLTRALRNVVEKEEALKMAEVGHATQLSDLQQQLARSRRETDSSREEINQIALQLQNARDELKRVQRSVETAEHRAADLSNELNTLRRQYRELELQVENRGQEASSQLADLRKLMQQQDEHHVAVLREKESEYNKSMEEVRNRHEAALRQLQASNQAEINILQEQMKVIMKEADRERLEAEVRMKDLQMELEAKLESNIRLREQEVSALQAGITDLEAQLQTLRKQQEDETLQLRSEVSRVEAKYKAVLKELDAKKKESERAESLTNGLKNQVESLREELKASQKAFREKLDMSSARLDQEWAARLEKELQHALDDKMLAIETLQQQWNNDRAQLLQAHEEEVRALKLLLQKEATDAAQQLARTERLRESVESQLELEKAARITQELEATERLAAITRELEENHRTEVERLKREFRSNLEGKEANLRVAHEAELGRLKSDQVAAEQHLSQSLRDEADASLRRALQELEQRLLLEKKTALELQTQLHGAERTSLEQQHEQERARWNESLQSRSQALEAAQKELRASQETINGERTERQRREEAFLVERDLLLRRHENDLRREKEIFDRRLLEAQERSEAEVRLLHQAQEDARGKYEERLRALAAACEGLEDRLRRRESRPEDLQRIAELEKDLIEKEEYVQRAREELASLKREMLNREENYNSKFSRSVNVGVMQVLRTKEGDAPTGSNNNNKAKPTQMRVINPQTGAAILPAGGGLGLGINTNPSVSGKSSMRSVK